MKAMEIAKYFICKNVQSKTILTHAKIQQILYFSQGWYLAKFNKTLFEDDIVASNVGPVIYDVDWNLRIYQNQNLIFHEFESAEIDIEDSIKIFLDEMWDLYKDIDVVTLIQNTYTHRIWSESFRAIDHTITKNSIKNFFKEHLNEKN